MRNRISGAVSLGLLGITLFFLILTVGFSTGSSADFRGTAVSAVLAVGGLFTGASLVFAKPSGNLPKKCGFYLTHAGIVLLLAGFALFEFAGDSVTAAVPVGGETFYSNIQRENGEICDLGFHFRADSRLIEYDETGYETQYYADLSFADPVTLKIDGETLSVNHPVRRNGWKIYLMSFTYAADGTPAPDYVNLILRRDPGEYAVKAGVVLLIAGTVLELLIGNAVRTKSTTKKEDGHD
ncbi:MAG: cytochrome c biogenesis protein ResB [Clostridia bacterium]|nr:cytochrome c biogenesis protein ResB [Clostridia bacterium]